MLVASAILSSMTVLLHGSLNAGNKTIIVAGFEWAKNDSHFNHACLDSH